MVQEGTGIALSICFAEGVLLLGSSVHSFVQSNLMEMPRREQPGLRKGTVGSVDTSDISMDK